jgi:hypothetical protein
MVRRGKYTVNAGPKRHTRKRKVLSGGEIIGNEKSYAKMAKIMKGSEISQVKVALPYNNESRRRRPSNNQKGMSHANALNIVHGPEGNPLARLPEKKRR